VSRPTSARAQSETVGTLLLLGVFVIAAGAVGAALVSDVASDGDEIVVSADMTTADRSDLDVSHLGGDAVSNSDLTVIIKAGENRTRIAFAPPSGEFAPATAAPSRTRSSRTPRTISCSSTNRLARCSSGLRSRAEPAPTVETGVIEGTVVGADPITSAASGATFGLRRSVTPVTGATVTAEEAGRVAEATTTADGAYQFEALKPGEYEVTVMAVGFISVTRPVTTVEANKTVTENFELDPLAPAEFAVTIDDVDTRVDAGEPVVVNATVENIGDEGDANDRSPRPAPVVDEETITLAGGESRQISLAWQTLPTDVGEVELAAASETDTATTTVRVLDAETDAVAYLDRDGDGSADETFTAAEMAFLNDLNGRFVVFDDARVAGSVAVDADRIAVEEDDPLRDRDRTGRRRRRVTRRRVDARHVKRMVIRLVDGRRDGPVRRSNRRAGCQRDDRRTGALRGVSRRYRHFRRGRRGRDPRGLRRDRPSAVRLR